MALRYGYFDSEITGVDENGMPILDRAETSDLFRLFFANIITNGVLSRETSDAFLVQAGNGFQLRVRPGFAMIEGAFVYSDTEATITIPAADDNFERYDLVVLRCDYLQRKIVLDVIKGTPSSTPREPELTRNSDAYEIGLAVIEVNKGATSLSSFKITDLRANPQYCGIITQAIDRLDTEVFARQLNDFYKDFVKRSNNSFVQWETQSHAQFTDWFNTQKAKLTDDQVAKFEARITLAEEKAAVVLNFDTRMTAVEGLSKSNKSDLDTLKKSVPVDYVIDQYFGPERKNWSWRKWASGFCEQWVIATVNSASGWQRVGSAELWKYGDYRTLQIKLTALEDVQLTTDWDGWITSSSEDPNHDSLGQVWFSIFQPTGSDGLDKAHTVRIYVRGRWK